MKITCRCGASIESSENDLTIPSFIFAEFINEHHKCSIISPIDLSLLIRFKNHAGIIIRSETGNLVYFKDVQRLLGVDND